MYGLLLSVDQPKWNAAMPLRVFRCFVWTVIFLIQG